MNVIKAYNKFNSYKTVFAIFFVTAVLSSALGFTLCRRDPDVCEAARHLCSAMASVPVAVVFEGIFLLWIFTAGPTIYAPASSFFAVLLYGVLLGARTAGKLDTEIYLIIIEVFFSTVTAYLLVTYSSFVTLTGIRIFTDVKTENKRELFDGVLFRAEGFKGIFNFRYVMSYIGIFLLFLLLLGTSAVCKVFLLSL